MKKRLSKIFSIENLPYIIVAIMSLIIFSRISATPGDDYWFSDAVDRIGNGSLVKYLQIRYSSWTGRIIIEAIMVTLFKYNVWIWRILNSIIMVLLSYGIYRLIPKSYTDKLSFKMRGFLKLCICISIFLISKEVFNPSIKWITGSFNYLWPMACGLIAILPYKYTLFKEDFNKKLYIFYILAAFLAGNMEQASLVILCFALLTNIYIYLRDKKAQAHLVIYNIFFLINTAILFLAPGNYIRSQKETITWFGEWDMISLPTKIMMGLNLLLDNLFNENYILIFIFTLLIFIIILKSYEDKLIISVSILPLLVLIIKCIEVLFNKLNILRDIFIFNLFELENLNLLTYDSFKLYLSTFFLLCILLLIPILLLFIFRRLELKYMSVILYLAAICSALSISVSPTIYASGPRVFFVTDIIIVILIGLLVGKFINKFTVKS